MNRFEYFVKETIPIQFRRLKMKRKIKKLRNVDFSIISSNCLGGVISKDFMQMQRSPTINMFFYPKDFLKFLANLEHYLSIDTIKDISEDYPVGLLEDIELHFLHYDSFQDAANKWNERKKRLNLSNLFIIMTDRDGCTEQDVQLFDKLPYENKILFSKTPYSNYSSVVYVKRFKGKYYNSFKNIFGSRYYDTFDFLRWFNGDK